MDETVQIGFGSADIGGVVRDGEGTINLVFM